MDQPTPPDGAHGADGFRSGFVALLGRPNVGKSTLLNALLGERVAPTNPKPQTTRRRLRGILTSPEHQIVFIDTPGFHEPQDNLGSHLVAAARSAVTQSDAVLLLWDAREVLPVDLELLELVRSARRPLVLGLNKVDLLENATPDGPLPDPPPEAVAAIAEFGLRLSALNSVGLSELVARLAALLPEGPLYYDPEQITAEPLRELAAEFIREAALDCLHQEVPYALEARIEEFAPRSAELTFIAARLFVERDSQVGIVVGRGGERLRKIGTLARSLLEELLETQVYLDLRVKVKPKWRKDESALREFGYHRQG